MDIPCPQCGNPNLQVDEANSVVYCQKCGFAVKVDPKTGQVTPLSQGGGKAPGAAPPAVYRKKEIFGMDGLTFFMLGTAVALLLAFVANLDLTLLAGIEGVLFLLYWFNR
ncbi:hypothetical protein COX86_03690 [Candidatus Micrarchaeota archaeon CG_4_10_14_0_2_um_filter_60_11]|nr:MAG: hypothetical protein AUJ16_01830 [Candidatus Micrarchaeota archaeon CG1_02_60_51]PIN96634.1 MAG: hypothetical protein COU39_00135 [Candidatus Micrarchaeota archaeon CG10_big_fil_rev_8_21_14_0_10_60_32]PIO02437.1 MAG: hypothetical protein COT58_00360 [Candidatus Micrarchaeota archaeon CG09_land_8_20_14_0_10_60_16]PIZ90686.1 MAG: hypothetical protein COX86_03690 [Candidatus Micrarchaeota archaeon CG_4_10_14_0_2_um_filter_60_11]